MAPIVAVSLAIAGLATFALAAARRSRTALTQARQRVASLDPVFWHRVEALRGKRLGCFFKPWPCHGDVLAEYLNSLPGSSERTGRPLWLIGPSRWSAPGPCPGPGRSR